MEDMETVVLKYTIHKFSSYSANYVPENIMVNKPSDLHSRWFTDSSTQHQFITLKLQSPSIVETIHFGKFMKCHVSNIKKFQVFGGTDENNLSLLLSGGLKNHGHAEEFRLRHRTHEGLHFPVLYIKIVPLQSFGPAYNYTIWFVELRGKNQDEVISNALETINLRKEEEAVRILLKHLRRHRYKDAYEALSRESGVRLEGPAQARLWNALVENGDYKMTEKIFEEGAEGELDWYMSWQPYTPEWRQMSACSARVQDTLAAHMPPLQDLHAHDRDLEGDMNGASSDPVDVDAACGPGGCCGTPGPRGGHQLVVDSTTGTLYLFGGWNGREDLDDLWSYNTKEERWRLLCPHSGRAGGPSPRSCHKMVYDPGFKKLYTLGRYLDNAQRIPSDMNSELHAFELVSQSWSLVCAHTAQAGGPRLVFDHQMCIDHDTHTIYVFGGRVLPTNSEEAAGAAQYSGLYAYYIRTDTWQRLLPDEHDLYAPQPRVSHSMLFHPISRRLYIFAGQRHKQQLADLWWVCVDSARCERVCDAGRGAPPADGFTQRATLDPHTDEIYLLAGMSKERDKPVHNTLWVLSLRQLSWSCVYRNDTVSPHEPRPRYAHQLVYDPITKIHYLFGGNPGNQLSVRLRLDDLWSLRLHRPTLHSVLNDTRFIIREACYRELCAHKNQIAALEYLRTELSNAVDHSDDVQVSRLRKLATVLFSGSALSAAHSACEAVSPRRTRALRRRRAAASAAPPHDIGPTLAVVLGAEDSNSLESPTPYERVSSPEPDTWEVGVDESAAPHPAILQRAHRIALYDTLAKYYRPSVAPPEPDVMDLVKL